MANQPYGAYTSYTQSRMPIDHNLSSSSSRFPYASYIAPSELSKYSHDHSSSIYLNPSAGYSSWSGIDSTGLSSGLKRSVEALYNQNVLGSHNTMGQNDALFSSNSLFKHPRLESSSHLPIYAQRPGEKDCAHYMLTRTCKFGDSCKFDHPIWVPEGGIADWKEGMVVPAVETLPERPGEPDCPYYMKTQNCKFGFRCKFNHPKDKLNALAIGGDGTGTESKDPSSLPERPGEPICAYYSKTGKCSFGATCRFHHPKNIQIESTEHNSNAAGLTEAAVKVNIPFAALLHNSKGLPVRPGETDCPFYLKTGSCKYGATCRYNHPERTEINPPLFPNINQMIMPSATGLPVGLFNSAANLFPAVDPLFSQASLGGVPTVLPQRPGQTECDYYMKTGKCTFGERCKFHHPITRLALNAVVPQAQPNVKLTLAGLPRREGSVACPFYMKTGTCKFGITCKFDHPPPGEAIAMATAQGSEADAKPEDLENASP